MSAAQMTTARIVALSVLGVMAMATVLVLNWPEPSVAAPQSKPVVVTKAVTPPGCERFVASSDAFVSVTEDFLAIQNDALDALIAYDPKALTTAVDAMTRMQERYDAVMGRYSDARAGCL